MYVVGTFELFVTLNRHTVSKRLPTPDTLYGRPVAMGGYSGSVPPDFVVVRKIGFKYTKNKNLIPLKMHVSPQTLKPGYIPAVRNTHAN